jgi:hypothetical protein
VEHSQFSYIYRVESKNDLGDNVVNFLHDTLYNCDYGDITELVLQSDPLPFTCSRTVYSIAKGVQLSNKNVKITFVSGFLTYFGIVSQCVDHGVMVIPFMGGKFFACRYDSNGLMDVAVRSFGDIDGAIYVDDYINSDTNLAKRQREVLSADIACDSLSHVRVM